MNPLEKFWANYPVAAHALAGILASLIAAYGEVPVFHDFVNQLYHALPAHAQTVATVAIALLLWYKQNRKTWSLDQRIANVSDAVNSQSNSAGVGK